MSEPVSERRLASRAAFLAGGLSAGMAVLFLVRVSSQGDEFSSRVWLVAAWFVVSAALCLAGAFTLPPRRRALLVGAGAALLIPAAVAALFSFVLMILVPALLAGWAASMAAHEGGIGAWQRVAAAVLLVVAASGLLLVGFNLTA
jgi:hypothetical protein